MNIKEALEVCTPLITSFAKSIHKHWGAVLIALSIATLTGYELLDDPRLIIVSVFCFALPVCVQIGKVTLTKIENFIKKKFYAKTSDYEWQKKFCADLSIGALLMLKELKDAENGIKLNKANRYILELSHYLCVIEVSPTTLEFGQYYSYYALQPWANALVTKQTAFINELLSKEAANENHPY